MGRAIDPFGWRALIRLSPPPAALRAVMVLTTAKVRAGIDGVLPRETDLELQRLERAPVPRRSTNEPALAGMQAR